jgi:ribosomal protein L7/L12
MLDPDIQALVEMGDLVAATGLYHQRHGGSVLVARKAIDAARWALTQSRGASLGAPQSHDHGLDSRDAGPPAATLVIDDQIAASLRNGHKIEAIKRYRDLYGVGLKEAKDAVEAIQAGKPLPTPEPVRAPAPEPSLQPELDRLIARGEKILAIKHYREITHLGLKESKDAVEARMATLASKPAHPEMQPELDRLIRANQKINAIKHYRMLTGDGLKECKDAVEARLAELGLA